MIDVEALLESAKASEGHRCDTCRWLDTRSPEERAKWVKALNEPGSYPHAQVARAMAAADPNGKPPSKVSIANHRESHRRAR